ncbi:MAG: 3-deoxy-D-manno-octulosonic acid transferase [Pseudomonadota bacterium]
MPIWLIWISYRLWNGKEDARRIGERFGFATAIRNDAPLVWIHAASVGESLIALTLIQKLLDAKPLHSFLITTGTITSAKIIESRLPPKTIHQFLPIDEYFCVRRFLKYWHPSLALFVESEIWPNLISMSAQYCPLILVNATMSDKSFINWQRCERFAKDLFGRFTYVLCQNEAITKKYNSLGSITKTIGNLKYSSMKPTFALEALEELRNAIGKRPVILAASTHPGDEEIICKLHIKLKKLYPDVLTIIAPRHPNRAEEILSQALAYDPNTSLRSKGESISEIYIADTLGELGLFFNIATVTIMGGSFKNGGHNIIEPAFFDTAIIFGPDMRNSEYIAAEFLQSKAAMQALDEQELFEKAKLALESDMSDMHRNAKELVQRQSKVIEDYMKIITEYI